MPDQASVDLLSLMIDGGLYVDDRRIDPVLALDLKDQGLLRITPQEGKLTLTEMGRSIASANGKPSRQNY